MNKSKFFRAVLSQALLASFITLASCSSGDGRSAETTAQAADAPEFNDQKLSAVYSHYIRLKDALVAANTAGAKAGAVSLQAALKAAGSSKGAKLAGEVAAGKDLAAQRSPFNNLSSEVERLLKGGKLASGTVYKQYCPMANSGNGGYWLASEKEVKNPYYGNEMLSCGEVKEEIR
jgi:hypothetical protein